MCIRDREIGYPYAVEFEINPDKEQNINGILFKGPHSTVYANWANKGKLAFSRDGYTCVFHAATLPAGAWTKVRIEGDLSLIHISSPRTMKAICLPSGDTVAEVAPLLKFRSAIVFWSSRMISILTFCGLSPVSYTHLDVYKRQLSTISSICVQNCVLLCPKQ